MLLEFDTSGYTAQITVTNATLRIPPVGLLGTIVNWTWESQAGTRISADEHSTNGTVRQNVADISIILNAVNFRKYIRLLYNIAPKVRIVSSTAEIFKMQQTSELSEAEMKFRKKRAQINMEKLQELLGDRGPTSVKEVCAVCLLLIERLASIICAHFAGLFVR